VKDIEIAKKILLEENLTLVVVKDGKLVFKSRDKGIKPIFTLATEMKELANGGSLADKVIGKGAAILCGYIGIQEIYTELISEGGARTLEIYNIPYTRDKSCEYIKNRDKTDYCPIEKLSMNMEEPETFIKAVRDFFAKMNK
jgi:hypothetical protein